MLLVIRVRTRLEHGKLKVDALRDEVDNARSEQRDQKFRTNDGSKNDSNIAN